MMPRRTWAAGGLAALLAGGRRAAAAEPDWPAAIAIATASPGGTYHAYGLGLARILTRELRIAVSIRESSGPAENLRLMATREAQLGFVTTGAALAARGERPLALFAMYDTPFHFVVRRASPVTRFADLAGRSVAVGPPGGTGADYAPRMLAALGAAIRAEHGSWEALALRFAAGDIDAMAVAAGAPFPAIAVLEARRAVRYLPLSPEQVTQLRLLAPELGASSIPAGTYPSLLTPYRTAGLYNLAVADRRLPAGLAFEIVRATFENHTALMEAHPAAAATVPANFVQNTVLPWHPGAMRYYGGRVVQGVLRGDPPGVGCDSMHSGRRRAVPASGQGGSTPRWRRRSRRTTRGPDRRTTEAAMLRIRLQSDRGPLAGVVAMMLAAGPVIGGMPAGEPLRASLVLPAQSGCQVAGPFATMRRANEVAAEARHRGYSAVAYHDGDGYYVRAC